jgi:hypothetical protein
MNLGDIRQSKFLKKDDVGEGVLVTIHRVDKENVAKEGAEPEMRACLYFYELDKPMVLNSTNAQIIAKITGHEENIEKNWAGMRIVLYNDPNVSFGGKLMGGIRVRAPKAGAVLPPARSQTGPASSPSNDNGDGLPF